MPRPVHTHFRNLKREIGVVVSTGMDRTAVVAVTRLYVHPLTRRIMRHVSKRFCHDHHEICGVGDKVQIKFWGAISKKKRYTVVDMVQRHPQLAGEPFPMSRLRTAPSDADMATIRAQKEEELKRQLAAAAAEAAEEEEADADGGRAGNPTKAEAATAASKGVASAGLAKNAAAVELR